MLHAFIAYTALQRSCSPQRLHASTALRQSEESITRNRLTTKWGRAVQWVALYVALYNGNSGIALYNWSEFGRAEEGGQEEGI